VRTEAKGKFMIEYFKSLGYGDRFEVVVVDDIAKEGAFDEAVKGVDAIEHIASPSHMNGKEPEEMIRPAIDGTIGILKSALKDGSESKVQRIVITSSSSSIERSISQPTIFSECDWNEGCIKEVRELGNKSSAATMYRASKTLAEKAAWEFYEQHKSHIKWDLIVINPPWVFGPTIQEVTSPSSLTSSMQIWYHIVVTGSDPKTIEALPQSDSWVDVRDTALAHVLALEKDEAGGERIITSAGGFNWPDWVDVVNSLLPSPLSSRKLQCGSPEITQGDPVYMITYDNSKQAGLFGIEFRSKLETTKDTLEDFARRGW